MERGVLCIVHRKDAKGFHIYGAWFVHENIKVGKSEAYEKFRLVFQAFSDDAYDYKTFSPTSKGVSQRFLRCIDPCDHELIMFHCNITKASTKYAKKSSEEYILNHKWALILIEINYYRSSDPFILWLRVNDFGLKHVTINTKKRFK